MAIDIAGFYKQSINATAKNILLTLNEKAKSAYQSAIYQSKYDVVDMFNIVAIHFYADYVPRGYRRRGSLYDIISSATSKNNLAMKTVLDHRKMTYRSGYNGENGLYSLVFEKGYHGGADKIDNSKAKRYGAHPSPGTPYWRKAPFSSNKWGEPAYRSTPPEEEFDNMINNYIEVGIYDKISRAWDAS